MKSKLQYLSLFFVLDALVAAVAATLVACGGGGADALTTSQQPTPGVAVSPVATQPTQPTGIAGLAGSSCTTTAAPQQAIYDLDKAGYTAYFMLRVDCKLADGTKQNIAGLPITAFKFNGSGVYGPAAKNAPTADAAPEAMVTGTSSLDGGATYVLQVYRKLAAPVTFVGMPGSTPVVRISGFGAETISIAGQDGQGRSITAYANNVQGGGANGVDDLDFGGVMSGASRTIDPDGMGFKATYFVTATAFQAGSTSPACPAGNLKEFAAVSLNNFGTKVDRRYCMYLDLTAGNFGVKFAGTPFDPNNPSTFRFPVDLSVNGWAWRNGADAGTQLSSLTVDAATLEPQTVAGNRTPIYKVDFSVRYPKKATPNFAAVSDSSVYGLAFSVPQFPVSALTASAWLIMNVRSGGTQWNDLPAR